MSTDGAAGRDASPDIDASPNIVVGGLTRRATRSRRVGAERSSACGATLDTGPRRWSACEERPTTIRSTSTSRARAGSAGALVALAGLSDLCAGDWIRRRVDVAKGRGASVPACAVLRAMRAGVGCSGCGKMPASVSSASAVGPAEKWTDSEGRRSLDNWAERQRREMGCSAVWAATRRRATTAVSPRRVCAGLEAAKEGDTPAKSAGACRGETTASAGGETGKPSGKRCVTDGRNGLSGCCAGKRNPRGRFCRDAGCSGRQLSVAAARCSNRRV